MRKSTRARRLWKAGYGKPILSIGIGRFLELFKREGRLNYPVITRARRSRVSTNHKAKTGRIIKGVFTKRDPIPNFFTKRDA